MHNGSLPEQDCRRSLRLAIFGGSETLLRALRTWFESHGHQARTAIVGELRKPLVDVHRVIESVGADVVVYDVPPPLVSNWDLLQVIRLELAPSTPVIVTTTNRRALDAAVREDTGAFELTCTAENLAALLDVVYRAAGPHQRRQENEAL